MTGKQATFSFSSDLRQLEQVQSTAFHARHIGVREQDVSVMCEMLGSRNLDALIDSIVPSAIRSPLPLDLPGPASENEVLEELRAMADSNATPVSMIGLGYHDCFTPPVIQRNILENPGWYTAYTPYQAEVSQGRLEALFNFQHMVCDLTGLPLAGASLLDEATAAAEAMVMARRLSKVKGDTFFVERDCHPQTLAVLRTRARGLGIHILRASLNDIDAADGVFGALLSYPCSSGAVLDLKDVVRRLHERGSIVVVATDLLALTLLTPPGEWDADIVVGSAQRFGVPMGMGGPHAAFLSCRDAYRRAMPGRLIGLSVDRHGRPALRMALQTREQHIRREKATSNICTAQVLLAVIAGMYAVYHGADGLRTMAHRVHRLACILVRGAESIGIRCTHNQYFDTVRLHVPGRAFDITQSALNRGYNIRCVDADHVALSLDETTTRQHVVDLLDVLTGSAMDLDEIDRTVGSSIPPKLRRRSRFLTHPVFSSYRSETELLRYLRNLQTKDIALDRSMIALGSCTMKLNAAAEMMPISYPGFARPHPFAPPHQLEGYHQLFKSLSGYLAEITGFSAVSLQPNAGSQGELAGLLAIRAYQAYIGEANRHLCLLPASAHGTNPASAALAGLDVMTVPSDTEGNIDLSALAELVDKHRDEIAVLMVTYPSTHGVFEPNIKDVCALIHKAGGQVYMDGANLNAMVGLARPADIGADVSHMNLHKTFCIPHGGGGPGMGPIGVKPHLEPFLPRHPFAVDPQARTSAADVPLDVPSVEVPSGEAATGIVVAGKVVAGNVAGRDSVERASLDMKAQSLLDHGVGAVSAAPWGSASILPISYAYIRMMAGDGLTQASKIAILNANYIAKRLKPYFPIVYQSANGFVAHECIIDLRPIKAATGVHAEDVAKRLIDFGFHAPTMSWPVPETLMIEPTESESKAELDRFCDALIAIRHEIADIEHDRIALEASPLSHAPHDPSLLSADWSRDYSKEQAFFPLDFVQRDKYWPPVSRVDNVHGDRHLICSWPDEEAIRAAAE